MTETTMCRSGQDANLALILGDFLPSEEAVKQFKCPSETDLEMALRGWCGPIRGRRWP